MEKLLKADKTVQYKALRIFGFAIILPILLIFATNQTLASFTFTTDDLFWLHYASWIIFTLGVLLPLNILFFQLLKWYWSFANFPQKRSLNESLSSTRKLSKSILWFIALMDSAIVFFLILYYQNPSGPGHDLVEVGLPIFSISISMLLVVLAFRASRNYGSLSDSKYSRNIYFFLLLFFPLGIWILQPEISAKSKNDLETPEISDILDANIPSR